MKSRERHAKQEVRRSKKEKKSLKQEIRHQKGSGKGAASGHGGQGPAAVRDRNKRSGVEAVKLHLETSGHNGRSSRSATTVIYQFIVFYANRYYVNQTSR